VGILGGGVEVGRGWGLLYGFEELKIPREWGRTRKEIF